MFNFFRVLENYPNFIPSFELPDVHTISRAEGATEDNTQMKTIRDHIANSLWEARRRHWVAINSNVWQFLFIIRIIISFFLYILLRLGFS